MNGGVPLCRPLPKDTGVAAQWGNYRWKNPKTSRRVTIPEMTEFATGYLGAHYIFWSTQEPFYSRDVLPFLGHN